ncbi:MAG: hypothetical protein U5K76_03425 [Woeseiaceae bacterium]|nr:hypothetical protein [Woeseiaceae bacterium]
MRRLLLTTLSTLPLVLAACGHDLDGTWTDDDGVTAYEFNSNGRARISVLGAEVTAEYRLHEDKVYVSSPQGTVVLTRRGDRLIGPMGLELQRRKQALD